MSTFPGPPSAFRRRIDLDRCGSGCVVGWLEDDFHHFGVRIEYSDGMVTSLKAHAERVPWATCPGAVVPLQDLVGKPLVSRTSDIGGLIDMRMQCTHMFDLAGLLLAHASQGREQRSYEVVVEDAAYSDDGEDLLPGSRQAWLWRDESLVQTWTIDGHEIVAPAHIAGRSLQRGFREWTETLEFEAAEQATVLRRAVFVAGGRMNDLDKRPTAGSVGIGPACHTHRPENRDQAFRVKGSTLRFESFTEMRGPLGTLA